MGDLEIYGSVVAIIKIFTPLMIQKKYPSKVLLFGEYTVLLGGQALAIPFPSFSGHWVSGAPTENHFGSFFTYLQKIQNSLNTPLHLQLINSLVEQGAHFESSIPRGIGLGSSAALSASIYDQFSDHSFLDIKDKMEDLALIESFFHGKSSGFDALVSLMQTPIWKKGDLVVQLVEKPSSSLYSYLLFTESIRQTQNLVQWFRQARREATFEVEMLQMSALSDQCISDFVSDSSHLFENLKRLSNGQFTHFNQLIVPEMQDLWASSLETDDFAIKLCGAGGGGCYLVMAPKPLIETTLGGFSIQPC